MASSGWQGEKTIYSGSSTTPRIDGNLRVDSISHSGSNLTITGVVQVISPSNSSIYYNGAYIWWSGGGSTTRNLNSNSGTKDTWNIDFSVTIGDVAATTTSYYFEMGVNAVQSGGSIGWTLSFDQSGTPPNGLTATLADVGPDWAGITVSISSYGSPSGSANRYIEAAILGSSSYGNPYKYKTKPAVLSETFTVDNSGSGNLTIMPNTTYSYGGFASNTVRSASTVTGQFTTLPSVPTVTAVDQGHGQIDFTVAHASEGSAATVTEEYSTDGGSTWTTITGSAFSLTLSAQTTITVRRTSSAGSSNTTLTVVPTFTTAAYVSVGNKTVAAEKIYVPVSRKRVSEISLSFHEGTDFVTDIDESAFAAQLGQISSVLALLQRNYELSEVLVTDTYNSSTVDLYFRFYSYSEGGHTTVSVDAVAPEDWGLTLQTPRPQTQRQGSWLVDVFEVEDVSLSEKVDKVYVSVGGKTKLAFEDLS